MQEALEQVYVGDRFYASTGKEITQLPTLKSIDEIDSAAIEQFKKTYPNAWVVTGRVTSTYLYKRMYSSQDNNLTASFWWVEIVDKNGKQSSFSLSAESPQFQNLKKGTVLSCFWITGLSLTHEIRDKDAQHVVTNDRIPGAVIIHNDDGQNTFIDTVYTPKTKKKIFLFFPALIIALIFFAYQFDFNKIGLAAGFGVGALVFVIEVLLQHSDYKRSERNYEAIKTVISQLQKISKNSLGFHLSERQLEPSDIICDKCDQRISNSALFCPKCGAKQSENDEKTSNSVVAIEEAILKEVMPLNYIDRYTHKYALMKDDEADVQVSFMFARVLSRDTYANVSDVTHTYAKTTTYKVYRHGVYAGTEVETSKTQKRVKTSELGGTLLIRLANGQIQERKFPEKLTGMLDDGDWFIFAESKASLDNPTMNIEYAYNLTKDKHISTSTFRNYKGRSSFGKWITRIIVFGVLHWGWSALYTKFVHLAKTVNNEEMKAVRENEFFIWASNNMLITENIFIILFVLLALKWLWKTFSYSRQNSKARKAIITPLRKAILDAQSKLPDLKERILRVSQ